MAKSAIGLFMAASAYLGIRATLKIMGDYEEVSTLTNENPKIYCLGLSAIISLIQLRKISHLEILNASSSLFVYFVLNFCLGAFINLGISTAVCFLSALNN